MFGMFFPWSVVGSAALPAREAPTNMPQFGFVARMTCDTEHGRTWMHTRPLMSVPGMCSLISQTSKSGSLAYNRFMAHLVRCLESFYIQPAANAAGQELEFQLSREVAYVLKIASRKNWQQKAARTSYPCGFPRSIRRSRRIWMVVTTKHTTYDVKVVFFPRSRWDV